MNHKRVEQQLRNFRRTVDAYDYREPFARFLTKFFKENRQMGSSDRRMTSRLCYNYFRLGDAAADLSIDERLVIAEFLCEVESPFVSLYKPSWDMHIKESVANKLTLVEQQGLNVTSGLFPFAEHLSPHIDHAAFAVSHLIQPDLFIRVKSDAQNRVQSALDTQNIPFEVVDTQTYSLPNGSKLQELKKVDGLYEVQDLSSQHSLDQAIVRAGERWWDACAASGGKSLMLVDRHPDIELVVSDVRLSILRNLDERFEKANVKTTYTKRVLDLTKDVSSVMGRDSFDGIILDAPCTGSGTWGRTPEMKHAFSATTIQEFATLQRCIATNVLPYLKTGGQLIYITCSVFEAENEGVLNFLESERGMKVETQGVIKGYDKKADSMFAARLRKI
ncbi:RsmB/NOP family class I SAM-dependent RNA methyltransferase [Sphingobacterium suaedae]